ALEVDPALRRQVKADAAATLRLRYEARLKKLAAERVARYVEMGRISLREHAFVAAANALRIAAALAPDDAEVQALFQEADLGAAAAMAEQYLEQARYEEHQGNFLAAARAYERVLRGRPGAGCHERIAHCRLEAGTDLRAAGEHARRATELAPSEPAYRITLARIYATAGMSQSALAELERARALSPSDATIADWIKRVKRGEP
ncbi:MAG: J domain-containing protein, partial [Deltaproteobacteria bacterium]|nr:J domain-containing protein [Deltaproteobacteria bacterium]